MTDQRRKPAASRKDESIRLRLTTREKARWTRVAEKAGRDLSNWIRYVANEAAAKAGVS